MDNEQLTAILAVLVGSGLLGSAAPAFVAMVIRLPWPSWAKALVALAASVLVGTASAWAGGQLHGLSWPAAVLVALGASEAAYRRWWKPTGVADWLARITSPPAPPALPPAPDGDAGT